MVDLSDGEKDNWDDGGDGILSWHSGKLRWDDISIQLTWEEEDKKVGEMVDKEMNKSFFLYWWVNDDEILDMEKKREDRWDVIWDENGMKIPTILWDFIYFSSNTLIKISSSISSYLKVNFTIEGRERRRMRL